MAKPKIGKPKFRVIGVHAVQRILKGSRFRLKDLTEVEREYFRDLHSILDDIFEEAAKTEKWTWAQLARHAGLSYLTVANLGDRKTKFPQFLTVYKLAKAVGWELVAQTEPSKKKAVPPKAVGKVG